MLRWPIPLNVTMVAMVDSAKPHGASPIQDSHTQRKESASSFFERGLDGSEVLERKQRFGPNVVERGKDIRVLAILFSQLKSPLVYILIIAAVITVLLQDYIDAVVIGLAVFFNTILGFYQEYKAQRALTALQNLLNPRAVVIRDGKRVTIDARDIVPGDVCLVGMGERIPADGAVMFGEDFSVSEALITGESASVYKRALRLKPISGEDLEHLTGTWNELQRDFKVFAGTVVSSGQATVLAAVTGDSTEIGKIARSLKETEETRTPLQQRIASLSRHLAFIVGGVALTIFITGLVFGTGEEMVFVKKLQVMFATSVAIAVASIPEGLPVALTVILTIGMQRILRRRSLVRKLVAAETLGSITVICVDKTGTLTEGVMRVTRSEFVDEEGGIRAATLTNDRRDPLEIAMWNWVREDKRQDPERIIAAHERLDAIPFSPRDKFSAKLVSDAVYVVGAPEVVLSFCSLPGATQSRWIKKFDEHGFAGLRIVGFAMRSRKKGERKLTKRSVKRGLTWLGILVYEDPVRSGVKEALGKARDAGVAVKVITGDYRATAEAVLEQLGILTEREKLASDYPMVIEGSELEKLTVEELRGRVEHAVLYARIDPLQKLKIVEALQANGEVVAMTGDGVNDAPALKKADIGIVVSGATDVSKETADMILLDDNFSTIIDAIEEGRGMFENLRKVLLYLLSDSFSVVVLILGSLLMRVSLPLTAAQILWINLVSDGFPDFALTVEPRDGDLMRRKARDTSEPLVNFEMKLLVVLISLTAGIATLLAFIWFRNVYGDISEARTVVFAMQGLNTLFYVFSVRSLNRPVWKVPILSNPWLVLAVLAGFAFQLMALYLPFFQELFTTRGLTVFEWGVVVAEAVLVIGIIELVKWVFLKKKLMSESAGVLY